MKTFVTLAFLAALGLLQAEADLRNAKPLYVEMPVNPKLTATEWRNIVAQHAVIPGKDFGIKDGKEPQPDFAWKVDDNGLRITNGNTASRGQFPWQVALSVDGSFFCGGSLISDRWILTAAHCKGSTYNVDLGANRLDIRETGSVRMTSRYSIFHRNYNPSSITNDIAVVQLPQSVEYTNYIRAVRLPSRSQQGNTYAGELLRVSGWGKISDRAPGITTTLQYVDLRGITNSQCARTYGNALPSSTLCVATHDGQSTCSGDSGGPLVHRESNGLYTLVGVVSFGSKAGCQRGYPAAFTRVTSYLDWIQSATGITIA